MTLKFFIPTICLPLFIILNSCSGQTKNVINENELSIILLGDTIAYYNGILDQQTKVTTVPYDTITIKKLITKNKEKYDDRLRVFIKMTGHGGIIEKAAQIAEISEKLDVFVTAFPLTKADKDHFQVEDFSWEPPEPVEVVTPKSVSTKTLKEFPAFLVEMRKDNSTWYNIFDNDDDTVMEKIESPVKENLKKVIADYNAMIKKENKKGVYYLKGDNSTKYPEFKEVMAAFKENDVFKFNMITLMPTGSVYETAPAENSTLDLFMPKDGDKQSVNITESTLTLLILKNNILVYPSGDIDKTETYDYKTIRPMLMKENKKFGDKFFVVIKTGEDASYKNTVSILDEMAICDIKRYAMVDLTPGEKDLIKKFYSRN